MKKNKILISSLILITILISRLIPHPPNFTNLLALSFYIPAIFGIRYIPILLLSYVITDLLIGYHFTTHWTWGSIFLISLTSQFFSKKITSRIFGSTLGSVIFFILTNFGVWLSGMYEQNIKGFLECFYLAIPFFKNTLISTIFFSLIFEIIYTFFKNKLNFFKSRIKY